MLFVSASRDKCSFSTFSSYSLVEKKEREMKGGEEERREITDSELVVLKGAEIIYNGQCESLNLNKDTILPKDTSLAHFQ